MTDSAPLAIDPTDKVLSVLGTAATALAQGQADAARAQADLVRIQTEGNLAIARIQAQSEALRLKVETEAEQMHAHQAFWTRIIGSAILVMVIGGGFATGRYELVTHALTAVVGGLAGFGLARTSKPQ